MTNKSEKEMIVDYALESEDNLEIAIRTHFAFDAIRTKIISTYLSELEKGLQAELGDDWVVTNDMMDNVLQRYSGMNVQKKKWTKYSIRLQQETTGARDFDLGVVKQIESFPQLDELKAKIDEEYKVGKKHSWWVWFLPLEDPYQNWDKLDTLLLLHRKTDSVDYLKRHFTRLARLAEDFLDKVHE